MLSKGTGLGFYEILSPLAAGGMGEVYRAHDTKLNRDVAIKVLPERLATDRDALARFEREAKAVAALNHPNILAIHDFGKEEETPYAVMELLEGETLREKLLSGPLSLRKVIDYATQIAAGLAAAHEKGIIHRDLKPDNLFVTKDGRVKILDFGLAKQQLTRPEENIASASTVSVYTEPGTILGTVGYMSPEQVRGKPLDARSDIFSFGAVLYEMLTGQRAFRGESIAETMAAITQKDPPPISSPDQAISPSLDHLLRRCLEKNPDERFHSASDLAYNLREVGQSSGTTVGTAAGKTAGTTAQTASGAGAESSVPVSPQRGAKSAAVVIPILIVLGVAAWLVFGRNRGKEPPSASAGPPPTASSTNSIVVLPFTNLSGDPKQAYFSNGITEELTNALDQNTGLTVIAWETASKYANGKQTPAEIGKALNVAHVLGGSIEHEGDTVRVSVELVSTVTGQQLWSAHYDDSFQNIFAVQDKITAAITEALKVKFAAMQAAPTQNPEAHELYLKGLAAMDRFTAADMQAAQNDFQQALKLDSNYADAWAGLAHAYDLLSEGSTLPLKGALPKIRAAAEKALALDPHNANALLELGNADANENRITEARAEYEQALALDPNNARAHLDYANMLPITQALAQLQEAARLDPDSAIAQNNLAATYGDLADWPQLAAAAREMNQLSPHEIDAAFYLAFAYSQMQRGEDAVKAFDLVQPTTALDRQMVDAGRLTYQALLKSDSRPRALVALESLRLAHISPLSLGDLFQLYLALGEKETALQILSGLCTAIPVGCSDLAVNPVYVPLHGDPRFEKLSKRYTTIMMK